MRVVGSGRRAWAALLSVGGALLIAAGVVAWHWWHASRLGWPYAGLQSEEAADVPLDAEMESRIKAFCGDCHAVPRPESFHRDAWHDEVQKGYSFFMRSGRTDLSRSCTSWPMLANLPDLRRSGTPRIAISML